MGWFSRNDDQKRADAEAAERMGKWERSLRGGDLPDFVRERLADAAAQRGPWLSTMTPAELLIVRSHGARPLATVTGTCWFQFGRSWTEGHVSGWRTALRRLVDEARACEANAIVDVKMRTSAAEGSSMDYTLVGTAIRFDSLPPAENPVVATTSALEFVRLLEAGIVPTGIAVGAEYQWLTDNWGGMSGSIFSGNQPLTTLGGFWEQVRRRAHYELRQDAVTQGNGVLAHTHFGQLIKQEVEKQPDRYLGRHIVVGTVVACRPGDALRLGIEMVVDMNDEVSPLGAGEPKVTMPYLDDAEEGAI
jgi:hypothetical protein